MQKLDRILARRELVTTILRLTSLGLLVTASIFFIYPVAHATFWDGLGRLFSNFTHVEKLGTAFTLAVPAVALIFLNRRLAKWIVPLPTPGCPQCGYQLTGLKDARCPECGLDMGRADANEPQQSD